MDVRTIDLDGPADPKSEVRLQSEGCRVSIWLPAEVRDIGKAIEALGAAGFDIPQSDDVS